MIAGDNPIWTEHQDRLERRQVAAALQALLQTPVLETPLTVGILGGWGSGKTSLMKLLMERLRREETESGRQPPLTLWFDAWLYARQEQSLWRALLLKVIHDLGEEAARLASGADQAELLRQLETLETSLYRSLTQTSSDGVKVNWGQALPYALDFALRWATLGASDGLADKKGKGGPVSQLKALLEGKEAQEVAGFIERKTRESYIEEVRSLEQFEQTFRRALELVGVGPAITDEAGRPGARPRRLYVFVDDLDRCLPEDALAAVEAIKLFLNVPGCVFVLGVDSEVIQSGIEARYAPYFAKSLRPFEPSEYLDKIIQLPFRLPPLDRRQVQAFVGEIAAADDTGLVADTRDLVEIAVPDNPRTLKRALNVLRLAAELDGCGSAAAAEAAARPPPETLREQRRLIARVVLLQICFPAAYRFAAEAGARNLERLFEASRTSDPQSLPAGLYSQRLRDLLAGETPPPLSDLSRALSLSRRLGAGER